eukprot:augustus_masked-scaffold_35-processed-gene-2.61-mRNA-1 protein AED:1.00 eAED:1.00 QI:0/-1/0/0/-1/1/1/0/776
MPVDKQDLRQDPEEQSFLSNQSDASTTWKYSDVSETPPKLFGIFLITVFLALVGFVSPGVKPGLDSKEDFSSEPNGWGGVGHIEGNWERVVNLETNAQKKLFKINFQDKHYAQYGKEEDGFIRVNEHNNRKQVRRRNMEAFDKVRVDYCAQGGGFESLDDLIDVIYANDTIDYSYSLSHNFIYGGEGDSQVPSETKKKFENFPYNDPILYKVSRKVCERLWGEDAPSDWYADAHVIIERHGPFKSTGKYDWNSVTRTLAKQEYLNQAILGTFFQPVFENGTTISYPPIHVHHTHVHPYINFGKRLSIHPEKLFSSYDGIISFFKEASKCVNTECLREFVRDCDFQSLEMVKLYRWPPYFMRTEVNVSDTAWQEQFRKGVLYMLEADNVERIERYKMYYEENEEIFPDRSYPHDVILQGHGDAECTVEQGGTDCVLHLLPEGQAYRITNADSFEGNYELNDVRADKSEELEFYVDIGFVVKRGGFEDDEKEIEEKPIETTFLQLGNPPLGFAWMTYMFPLDYNTNVMFYNFTNLYLGAGTMKNFILHTHMSYTDSLYVIKGDNVYKTLSDALTNKGERELVLPHIFDCHENDKDKFNKEELLKLVLSDTTNQLVCEAAKPTLVLYCSDETGENCIYRDRRIDFNCVEEVRLEEEDTLTVIAFNRVGQTSIKDNQIAEINRDMSYNLKAIYSSFGYHFAAHQHSYFRGDFVSDRARERKFSTSFGKASLDFLFGEYAPPSMFFSGRWVHKVEDHKKIQEIVKACPNSVSFDEILPWET